MQGVRGLTDLRAREGAKPVQGVRGLEHLRAREGANQVQGVRGLSDLRAREAEVQVQGVPRGSRRGGSRALPPVHPKPEILVEFDDVEDPGEEDEYI